MPFPALCGDGVASVVGSGDIIVVVVEVAARGDTRAGIGTEAEREVEPSSRFGSDPESTCEIVVKRGCPKLSTGLSFTKLSPPARNNNTATAAAALVVTLQSSTRRLFDKVAFLRSIVRSISFHSPSGGVSV